MATSTDTTATVADVLTQAFGPDWERMISPAGSVHNGELVLRHTIGRSFYGYEDPLEVANYRVLTEQWSDVDSLTDGPYSDCRCVGLRLDGVPPADLVDVITSLTDYPILDEQVWSEVEREHIEEHWADYGQRDSAYAVADALGVDVLELSEHCLDLITELTFGGIVDYGCGGGYPSFIDVSAVDFGAEAIAAWIRARVGLRVTLSTSYGRPHRVIDLRRRYLVSPMVSTIGATVSAHHHGLETI